MDDPVYEIQSLMHYYDHKPVLDIHELKIPRTAIVGLVGPNGSGKSTLLKILGLIERPSRGQVYFNGRGVEPFADTARFQISLLPQDPVLMKRSVYGNMAYGLKLRGYGDNLDARIREALRLVGLADEDFVQRPWYALSGGESHRVSLAARLALKPNVLLLDEPTAGVDAQSAQLIREAVLKDRQQRGTTLIIAGHDLQWLYEICDHILHLFKGRIFGSGRETVIYGPWQELGKGRWGKRLADNQEIRVPEPPHRDAVAVMDVAPADEKPDTGRAPDLIRLQGVVSQLSLDKNTRQVSATAVIGSHPFTVHFTRQHIQKGIPYPGGTIRIQYHLDRIRWL